MKWEVESATHRDGAVVIGRGGDAAVWHRLLVRQGGAALRFGLGAALGQAVVVDLVLLVGNLLAEAAGRQQKRLAQPDSSNVHFITPIPKHGHFGRINPPLKLMEQYFKEIKILKANG